MGGTGSPSLGRGEPRTWRQGPLWRPTISRKVVTTGLSIGLGLGIWTLVSLANPKLVPSISEVWSKAVYDYRQGVLVPDVTASLYRVAVGFAIGSAAGIAVGVPMGWYRIVRELAGP